MIRTKLWASGLVLILGAVPAFGAGHGGGGGHAGGGHPGGGHPGGGYSGGHGYSGGGYSHGGYYGNTGGLYLGLGLGFGGGLGGYGGGYYGGGGYSGGNYAVPNYGTPNYNYSGVQTLPPTAYTYPGIVNNPATNPTIIPQNPVPNEVIPLGVSTGLKINELYEGTAKSAGLRKGDIILKVDGTRTQSFEELRATLSAGKDKVVVEYIDGTSGETDKRTVGVDGTKIGVSVTETPLSK